MTEKDWAVVQARAALRNYEAGQVILTAGQPNSLLVKKKFGRCCLFWRQRKKPHLFSTSTVYSIVSKVAKLTLSKAPSVELCER